jgi:GGDEF domain-containing protein
VETSELVVWSAMLGGLLTLAVLAMGVVLVFRNANALRYLLFVALTGASSLMRTGLVETLLPELPQELLKLLKVCAGPLSAALVIRYMVRWLDGAQVDSMLHRLALWGTVGLLLAALVLGVLVYQVPEREFHRLLRASAIVTAVAALSGLAASIRAAVMGDPLARWAVLAAGCLLVALFGFYVRSMNVPGFGLGTWMLTAGCLMGYFLVGSGLVVTRIREARRLDRLASIPTGSDPATGLPTGAVLLSEVEHAFWRTARLGGECTVVCLHVANLYALGESAGPGAADQILTATAARIRRAAGFRCVVGLYHPLCFVVVISADKRREYVGLTLSRLHALAAQALTVVGQDGAEHHFRPQLGMGVVTPPDIAQAKPMEVIHRAEQQALGAARRAPEDELETMPGGRFADTVGAAL